MLSIDGTDVAVSSSVDLTFKVALELSVLSNIRQGSVWLFVGVGGRCTSLELSRKKERNWEANL